MRRVDILSFSRSVSVPLVLAVLGGAPGVQAQSTDVRSFGAVVSVAGNGGDIRAAGASVTIRGPADAIRAAGARVDVRSQTTDSVWAGGAQVSVDGTVGRNLKVGGAIVEVRGQVVGDARVGALVVEIDGDIGGNLRVGAANVTLSRNSRVGGNLTAGGVTVSVGADIAGDVKLGGAVVNFAGRAGGDVTIAGEDVSVSGLAAVDGDLVVYSRNPPQIADGATIGGSVKHVSPGQLTDIPGWLVKLAFALAVAAGTIVAGLVMLLFGGRLLAGAADSVRRSPLSSLIVGVVTLIVIPVASMVLLSTGVGFTAALALILTLPFLIVFGHAAAATGIAGGVLIAANSRLGVVRTFVFLVIGSIVIALVVIVPWVGPWLVLAAMLTGLGAFTRTVAGRLRRHRPEPAFDAPSAPAPAPPTQPAQEAVAVAAEPGDPAAEIAADEGTETDSPKN